MPIICYWQCHQTKNHESEINEWKQNLGSSWQDKKLMQEMIRQKRWWKIIIIRYARHIDTLKVSLDFVNGGSLRI